MYKITLKRFNSFLFRIVTCICWKRFDRQTLMAVTLDTQQAICQIITAVDILRGPTSRTQYNYFQGIHQKEMNHSNSTQHICCGYLLESPRRGDSNKYPQHMFLGVNMERSSFLSFIILVHVGFRYSGKFVLNGRILGGQMLSL